MSPREIKLQLDQLGGAFLGQGGELAPLRQKALCFERCDGHSRESFELITASILSKKLSEGISSLVMDIKVGKAAFCKELTQAEKLRDLIFKVSKDFNLNCSAIISQMDEPLGYSMGNALEIAECIKPIKRRRHS